MGLIVTEKPAPYVPDAELDRIWRALRREHEWSTLGDTRDSRAWVRDVAAVTGAIEERVIASGVRVGVLAPEFLLPELGAEPQPAPQPVSQPRYRPQTAGGR